MKSNDIVNLVFALDQQQSDPARGQKCKTNADHGRMGVHGSGALLMCGARGCGYEEPSSLIIGQ